MLLNLYYVSHWNKAWSFIFSLKRTFRSHCLSGYISLYLKCREKKKPSRLMRIQPQDTVCCSKADNNEWLYLSARLLQPQHTWALCACRRGRLVRRQVLIPFRSDAPKNLCKQQIPCRHKTRKWWASPRVVLWHAAMQESLAHARWLNALWNKIKAWTWSLNDAN